MRVKRVVLVLGLLLVFCLGACGKSEEAVEPEVTTGEQVSISEGTEEPKAVMEETTEERIPVIYEDDVLVNLYLNRYNEVNTEVPIKREDFEIYHHHGSDHKDQILFSNGVIISAQTGDKIKIVVEGNDTEEAYKEAFFRYARGYNTELSVEVLEDYWEQSMSNLNLYTKFDDFEVYIRSYNDIIELLEISGEVE